VRERGILFSGPMVAAILAGRKTQTRRVVKSEHAPDVEAWAFADDTGLWRMGVYGEGGAAADMGGIRCPFGVPGDRLWVRETHAIVPRTAYWHDMSIPHAEHGDEWAIYRAGWTRSPPTRWRPSIHMPRWASHLTLEVVSVRVERLQTITEEDAVAEGVPCWVCGGRTDGTSENDCACFHTKGAARDSFGVLWDSINGEGSWDANPWVWVVDFRRVP
jgi:hypothetical protein